MVENPEIERQIGRSSLRRKDNIKRRHDRRASNVLNWLRIKTIGGLL